MHVIYFHKKKLLQINFKYRDILDNTDMQNIQLNIKSVEMQHADFLYNAAGSHPILYKNIY